MARGCPVDGRKPASLHFYKAKCDGQIDCRFTVHAHTFVHYPLQKCSRSVLRTAKAFRKDSAPSFHPRRLLRGSLAPLEKFCKPEVATKMATSSNPVISTVPRGCHPRGQKRFNNVVVNLTTFFFQKGKPFAKSRWSDGSNCLILISDRECVDRIQRK